MSNVLFISDLHLGHKKILRFSPDRGGSDDHSHAEWLVTQWNSKVNKNDLVYVLGDVCFDEDYMKYLGMMKGQKKLIIGNHDKFSLQIYKEYFNDVHGFIKKYGFWLSHAPIHPIELRGHDNIHGHVHMNSIDDFRYINVCVEALNGKPISLDEVRKR